MTVRGGRGDLKPRAVVHKNILDVAAENPEATLTELADEVPGASVDLVDRVLDEYGDPGDGNPTTTTKTAETTALDQTIDDATAVNGETMTATQDTNTVGETASGTRNLPELTEKQRRTLRMVSEHPEASQSEIGEMLNVTAATINNRLNSIPGFEWDNREAFAASVIGETETDSAPASQTEVADEKPPRTDTDEDTEEVTQHTSGGRTVAETVDQLDERLATIETKLAAIDSETDTCLDPGLAHKVVHAAMDTDYISEEEELQLLRELMS